MVPEHKSKAGRGPGECCPQLTGPCLWTLHFPQGPQELVCWRLGQKPSDIIQPVYGPGASEITPGHTLTIQPWRGRRDSKKS